VVRSLFLGGAERVGLSGEVRDARQQCLGMTGGGHNDWGSRKENRKGSRGGKEMKRWSCGRKGSMGLELVDDAGEQGDRRKLGTVATYFENEREAKGIDKAHKRNPIMRGC